MRFTAQIHSVPARFPAIKKPYKVPMTHSHLNLSFRHIPSAAKAKMVSYAVYKVPKRMPDGRKIIEPQWLDLLLKKKFFGTCKKHQESRKSEINIYCTECDVRMCSHCITEDMCHRCHRLLQIRRYVYSDVVKIDEMQKHIDCSKIQPYSLNQAKVIFLNPKSKKSKPSKPPHGSIPCNHCRRPISAPNRYCSIACKVSYESVDISMLKNKSGPLILPSTPDLEDISPQAVELPSCSLSSSSSQPSDSAEENHDRPINQEARPKLRVRVRKGIPRRAPFF